MRCGYRRCASLQTAAAKDSHYAADTAPRPLIELPALAVQLRCPRKSRLTYDVSAIATLLSSIKPSSLLKRPNA